VERAGAAGELVAQQALRAAQGVLALLADQHAHLLGVAVERAPGLGLVLLVTPRLLLPQGPAPEAEAEQQHDRGGHRDAQQAAGHAEHDHAAVRAPGRRQHGRRADAPVGELAAEGDALELGHRSGDGEGDGAGRVLLELLADPVGQLGGPLGQVVVRGHRRRHHLAAQPHLELAPRLGGVAAGDDLLARPHHHLEPGAQVVVDVGHQVLDAVGQHLLPRRPAALQRLGRGRRLAQPLDEGVGLLGPGHDLGLGLPAAAQLAGHEADLGGHPLGPGRAALGHHRRAQELDQRRVARLGVHGVVDGGRRPHPQERRHRHHRDVQPGAGQVVAVELDDAPPLGVEVGLGDHAHDLGAPGAGRLQEADLGARQLLGGVGHEDEGLGQRHDPEDDAALG
jgi:hypothetical protein